jgi:hypothetical protein
MRALDDGNLIRLNLRTAVDPVSSPFFSMLALG